LVSEPLALFLDIETIAKATTRLSVERVGSHEHRRCNTDGSGTEDECPVVSGTWTAPIPG